MRDLVAACVASEPTLLRQTCLHRLEICIRTRDGTSADSTSHKLITTAVAQEHMILISHDS